MTARFVRARIGWTRSPSVPAVLEVTPSGSQVAADHADHAQRAQHGSRRARRGRTTSASSMRAEARALGFLEPAGECVEPCLLREDGCRSGRRFATLERRDCAAQDLLRLCASTGPPGGVLRAPPLRRPRPSARSLPVRREPRADPHGLLRHAGALERAQTRSVLARRGRREARAPRRRSEARQGRHRAVTRDRLQGRTLSSQRARGPAPPRLRRTPARARPCSDAPRAPRDRRPVRGPGSTRLRGGASARSDTRDLAVGDVADEHVANANSSRRRPGPPLAANELLAFEQ